MSFATFGWKLHHVEIYANVNMKDTARIKAACLSKTLFVALQTQELVIILDFPPSLEIASGPNFRPNPQ